MWIPLFFFCLAPLIASEKETCERIQAHLLVRDYQMAVKESEKGLLAYPLSLDVQKMRIRSLAQNGEDGKAIEEWVKYGEREDLIETVSWGVLSKGSPLLSVSMTAMMGAALTHDVKATLLLLNQMRSTNALMRLMAVRLAVQYRDQILIDELLYMLENERVWYVKLEAIGALGKMGVKEAEKPLRDLLLDDRRPLEEQLATIEALAQILDNLDEIHIRRLARSKRAGLRQLSSVLIGYFEKSDLTDLLHELSYDTSPFVRFLAAQSLGWLHQKSDLKEDTHPLVEVMRGYVNGDAELIKRWLYSSQGDIRLQAAWAISHMGKEGWKIAYEALKDHPDLYVRVNIALGILGQQVNQERCLKIIDSFLRNEKKKIMWQGNVLAKSDVAHRADLPGYPIMVDQQARLNLINILAMFRYPQAQELMVEFLKMDVNGITFAAAMMLLEEGEGDLVEILVPLLQHEDAKVRVQAALVLALVGEDRGGALEVLHRAYYDVDRTTKINIIAALGHIGKRESIPFLKEVLKEPFQVLRVVAASSLIQCLYH
ncbi:MAG: HEAT repeat domain-containing protein [Simkaniaceae bacterium]|nr:HEAT repeat domain-containing protein [Simkaniaceae bacterium]